MTTRRLYARLPSALIRCLDATCTGLGLSRSRVIEEALREKLECLLDTEDLLEVVGRETEWHPLDRVRLALLGPE